MATTMLRYPFYLERIRDLANDTSRLITAERCFDFGVKINVDDAIFQALMSRLHHNKRRDWLIVNITTLAKIMPTGRKNLQPVA